jgi:hypothetical protein
VSMVLSGFGFNNVSLFHHAVPIIRSEPLSIRGLLELLSIYAAHQLFNITVIKP